MILYSEARFVNQPLVVYQQRSAGCQFSAWYWQVANVVVTLKSVQWFFFNPGSQLNNEQSCCWHMYYSSLYCDFVSDFAYISLTSKLTALADVQVRTLCYSWCSFSSVQHLCCHFTQQTMYVCSMCVTVCVCRWVKLSTFTCHFTTLISDHHHCWAVNYNSNASSLTQTLKSSCGSQHDYVTTNLHCTHQQWQMVVIMSSQVFSLHWVIVV